MLPHMQLAVRRPEAAEKALASSEVRLRKNASFRKLYKRISEMLQASRILYRFSFKTEDRTKMMEWMTGKACFEDGKQAKSCCKREFRRERRRLRGFFFLSRYLVVCWRALIFMSVFLKPLIPFRSNYAD